VLLSHEIAKRGCKDVGQGEVCKIPGVGPVAPEVAKEIAHDAFVTGVLYDGTDLRQIRRWSRTPSVEVLVALELGEPPGFDGIKCLDCGNRFGTERCWRCHRLKTERDRKAGKLKPPEP
jgi:hypothetical protein